MAKSRKRKRKIPASSGKSQGGNSVLKFLKSERTRFIFGVIVAFAGVFLLLAMVSLLFTGAKDYNQIEHRSFFSLISDKSIKVDNWTGAGGAFIAEKILNGWFGIFSMLIPIFIINIGLRLMKVSDISVIKAFFITAYGLICGSISCAFIFDKLFQNSHINWGGRHGTEIVKILENSIGLPGLVLLVILFGVVTVVLYRKSSMYKIQKTIVNGKSKISFPHLGKGGEGVYEDDVPKKEKKPGLLKRLFAFAKKKKAEKETVFGKGVGEEIRVESKSTFKSRPEKTEAIPLPIEPSKPIAQPKHSDFEVIVPKDELLFVKTPLAQKDTTSASPTNGNESDEVPNVEEQEDFDPKKELSSFQFPSMEILKVYNSGSKEVDMREQNDNKDKIIHTLRNYGIEITSITATVGPTITLYEIIPQAGVRISKIKNLEDDIALSLSALGIRIIAPMPGKGTIGIEVPNKDPQIVSMQSVIASKKFQECSYELPVALGKTITNDVFIFDLAKMPHLLVSGATGQGKSVGLNAIITSLLYKKHPSEMKMVLVDPKMVEFNIYSTIEKHYLAKLPDEEKAIITDVTKVTETLNSLTKEMDDRYELLMRAHVRTIKEYNEKFIKHRLNPNNGHRYLPYVVVIIDEFGDLIMTAGKEIEMPIARIAQKARAVGMHMVIATQRPTTNIITGTIKANFPARMAFRVTSQIDSRTILDMNGANQLIGRGDMLFSQGSSLIRIQCAFVDTPEVEEIAQYIGNQRGFDAAFALPEVLSKDGDDKSGGADLGERDPLFDEAARLIVVHQQGSTSLIQRKFSIGYNRAGRLMDQLESAGVVGPAQGSKPRDVYISDEYSLEKLLDSLR
ncbi:MAG: DNA translocase FtsK [Dysgonamonadaceae bacterium]|jgi:S-DNA-T family DNA segregation ATPase FtsK/SpoIIIE|nr:DNA translocase FtsK [Dysgonamonadaceae bacterium]